jgi:Rap1a immunity proteins
MKRCIKLSPKRRDLVDSAVTKKQSSPIRMTMKASLAFLSLHFALLPLTAHAELSLNQLAKQCEGLEPQPSEPSTGILMCISYIGGALDQIILADGIAVSNGTQAKAAICGPEQGKLEKLVTLVKFTAKQRLDLREESARSVLRGLIIGEFKCT